jgi:hypothetical protein
LLAIRYGGNGLIIQINKEPLRIMQRSIVLSVVVLSHIGLLKLPWTSRTTPAPAGFESIVMLLPDKAPPPEPLRIPNNVEIAGSKNPLDKNPIEIKKPDETPDLATTSSTSEATAPTPLEWRAVTNAAIQQAAKAITTKPTTRRFGESTQQPRPASEPQTLFTGPAHRFGDTTKTQDGDAIVWLSDHCYQIANSDSSHFMAFATGMPDTSKSYVRCKGSFDKAQSNSHLFDHLKRNTEATE